MNLLNGLTINGGTVNLTNAGGLAAGTYTLIDYAGTITGTVDNLLFGSVPGGFGFDLVDTGSVINLLVSAAPTNDADFNNDGTINAADYPAWRKFNPKGDRRNRKSRVTRTAMGTTTTPTMPSGSRILARRRLAAAGRAPCPSHRALMLIGLALIGFFIGSRRGR